MKLRKKHDSTEDNFWISATDMMAGILTIVLLLLMLFILYLNQSADEVFTPLEATAYTLSDEGEEQENNKGALSSTENINRDIRNNGGANSPTEAAASVTQVPTQPPTVPPTEKPGSDNRGDEPSDKAAVLVRVVDADTGNTLKESGIEFELYDDKEGNGRLQTLSTYYPKKTEYKKFSTDDKGTFYLPEKIAVGWYSLHNLKAPEGYYPDSTFDFEIDDNWDWSEPYEVKVPLEAIKNTIRIRTVDAKTVEQLPDIAVKVLAGEDIKLADGTIRYAEGDVVDELKTDSKGFAESKEVFVGKYKLKQTSAPEYYAVNPEMTEVEVGRQTGDDDNEVKIDCHKTFVSISLTDARTEEPIVGAVYAAEGRGDYVTDKTGMIALSDLKKSAIYKLRIAALPSGYRKKTEEIFFTVDEDGLVNGEYAATIEDTAYTLSLSVDVQDLIFGKSIAGEDMEIINEDGSTVKEWSSGEKPVVITGLTVGMHYLQRAGDEGSRVTVDVQDTVDVQKATIKLWGTFDWFAVLMALGAVSLGGLFIWLFISRKNKKSKTEQSSS